MMLTLEESHISAGGCRSPVLKTDQIEAVPEWVAHISDAPVFADLYFTVERSPEAAESGNQPVEIGHDKIEVYGCPMPSEIAFHPCRAKLCHSRAVGKKEDWQISA